MSYDKVLDTSGLFCPQVLLKAKKLLSSMEKGEILKVISTDPSSVLDFKVFVATHSHALVKVSQQKKKFTFWIKK
ncbi:MAG: sulfurtransferase TusA family protein [Gammaproteobacteria bacterium]|nr:sulfurtransferase TusA family protein [Gammaproteobacteria bacterium]